MGSIAVRRCFFVYTERANDEDKERYIKGMLVKRSYNKKSPQGLFLKSQETCSSRYRRSEPID